MKLLFVYLVLLSAVLALPRVALSQNADTRMAAFDTTLQQFMASHNVPGTSLAVVKDGKLVYVKQYGFADLTSHEPVTDGSLFRIASISKPITALAIMKLVDDEKLSLDQSWWSILGSSLTFKAGQYVDPRMRKITIRQLIEHRGGFRTSVYEPMGHTWDIARELGVPSPADPMQVIQYMATRGLDFDPGSEESYSNFGYCILGEVIRQVSGTTYQRFVQKEVLLPMGITRMRLGKTDFDNRAPGEVRYYDEKRRTVQSVLGEHPTVEYPYGGDCMETMAANGGWIASAVDIAKFIVFCTRPNNGLIAENLRHQLFTSGFAKAYPFTSSGGWYRWSTCISHTGSLPGTCAAAAFYQNTGVAIIALCNGEASSGKGWSDELSQSLTGAMEQVKTWPTTDMFPQYRATASTPSSR